MNRIFKHWLLQLYNLGVTKELSPIDTVRYRVINLLNFLVLIAAFFFLGYRIYDFDLVPVIINGVILLLTLLNIFFCRKVKHDLAIKLISFYLLALAIYLSLSALFISGLIYLTILPMTIALMYREAVEKHLYYFICACIFTYFSYELKLDIAVLVTYYLVTFGFYITLLSFFSLAEQKQRELEQVIASLENKNADLYQFSHITSHDLQEPLGIIRSFSQLLLSKYSQTLDEVGRVSIEHINNASHRMSALIKGLLDYSLIGKSGNREPIIVAELIKKIKKSLQPTLASTNTTIIVDDIPIIWGYKAELQMLFQHLIINAIKFQQPHNFPVIRISVEEKNDFWQLAIKDNGIGIEQKYLTKIFEIFQRLHTREKYEGNGIGLSHCKKIAYLHGGNIWVASKLNHGSVFYFTIKEKRNKTLITI